MNNRFYLDESEQNSLKVAGSNDASFIVNPNE